MMRFIPFLALIASPLMAQDYAANSDARSWNLYGESPARFEAHVVDVLCELTGDCAENCGNGRRQLGLVDGLLLEDEDVGAKNVYLVQKIRTIGDENWTKANRWTKEWAKANPAAKGKGPWFRRDPRVNASIAAKGHLGLGLETDEAFIKEWFE